MKKQIVLATNNKHKIREIKSILSDLENIEILDLTQFPEIPTIIENGKTIEENAIIKAKAVFEFTKIISLADDTGLFVDYLLGKPGVYSSRYAGENVTYKDNNKKLLFELKGVPPRKRTARFKCCVAVYGDNLLKTFIGTTEGKILFSELGTNGFGYDPLFLPDGYNKTYAQMSEEEKNKVSHRYKALALAKDFLKGL